ncbi:hypothetical protein V5799_000950 [Amblyomma americanum]|uniref:C2H2-type domain-containing protein n=1 Tax=Amblyomma americanum TaxID=6943 RepID=A0AAQ4D1K7_AMBAM
MTSEEKLTRMRPYLTFQQWHALPDCIKQWYGNIKEHYELMERLASDNNEADRPGDHPENGALTSVENTMLHKSGEAALGDGPPPESSDWMRYLNCAPNQRDQNLVACIRDGKLCYRTRRAIGAGQELLVEDGTALDKTVLTVGKPLNSGEPAQDADSGVTGQRLIFTCDTCGSLFSSQDLLDRHRRAMHRPPEQAGQHRCAQCPYSSCHESDLTMHAMTHAGEQFFVCGMCSKRFPSKFSLRLHMKSHESHQCPDCGRRFVRLCGLSRHRRSHCGRASRAAAPQ